MPLLPPVKIPALTKALHGSYLQNWYKSELNTFVQFRVEGGIFLDFAYIHEMERGVNNIHVL